MNKRAKTAVPASSANELAFFFSHLRSFFVVQRRIKSYFRHTHPGLQSLVPSLSPLLVHSLRVSLQADSSGLLVTTAACKHQSCLTQSSGSANVALPEATRTNRASSLVF